jgi:hypothetical protein
MPTCLVDEQHPAQEATTETAEEVDEVTGTQQEHNKFQHQ